MSKDNSTGQRHWQAHVKALTNSGLNRAEYCRQHGLSYHALTYWNRKLSSQTSKGATLVPLSLQGGFQRPHTGAEQPQLKILLPGRISVAVGDNFSPETLSRLLTTLTNR